MNETDTVRLWICMLSYALYADYNTFIIIKKYIITLLAFV